MRRLLLAAVLVLGMPVHAHAADDQGQDHEYLYYRDLTVPPFQSLREFFDLPNHPGSYEITLVSEALGPLTFKVMRVRGEHETTLQQYRSYHIHDHEFHLKFDNTDGQADLMVSIANSNPATSAKVTVIVVQLP
ncbi:MAG TPA: hypothetical protein VNH42_00415 [Mariprofundaceae bacterium]|nr:hypothetical protein [Mariprofundaceae bacterium]